MSISNLPFMLEIPITMGSLKYVFFVTDRIYVSGNQFVATPHNHSSYELRYTVSGKGNLVIEDKTYTSQAGDLILVHPMEYHHQEEDEFTPYLSRFYLSFSIKAPSKKAPAAHKKSYDALIKTLQSIRVIHDHNMQLLPYFQAITEAIAQKKYGYFNHLQAMCILLFTDFIRLAGVQNTTIFPSPEQMYSNYWTQQLEGFLGFRYMENIKLPDLAAFLQVSERQASRIVMREYGVNYTTMLMQFRVQKAKHQLLQNPEKDLQKVGADCGFQSYTYFITCFRKIMGKTPADYRAEHLASPNLDEE